MEVFFTVIPQSTQLMIQIILEGIRPTYISVLMMFNGGVLILQTVCDRTISGTSGLSEGMQGQIKKLECMSGLILIFLSLMRAGKIPSTILFPESDLLFRSRQVKSSFGRGMCCSVPSALWSWSNSLNLLEYRRFRSSGLKALSDYIIQHNLECRGEPVRNSGLSERQL